MKYYDYSASSNELLSLWTPQLWREAQSDPHDPVANLIRYANLLLERGLIRHREWLRDNLTSLLFTNQTIDHDWYRLFHASLDLTQDSLWDRVCRRVPRLVSRYQRRFTRVKLVCTHGHWEFKLSTINDHRSDLDVWYLKEPTAEYQLIREFRGLIPDSFLEDLLRTRLAITRSAYVESAERGAKLMTYFIRRGGN